MNIKQTYHKLQQESVQNFNGHLSAGLLFIIENLIFLIKTLTRESPEQLLVQFHYTNQSFLTQISVEQILSIVPPVWAYVTVSSVLPSCCGCSC